jgi:deoxyguanosine kinase
LTQTPGIPRYIAVEGPIGVGKTTLARRLARTFGCELLLETPENNPFLERFYQNRRQAALPTQLFFLFERAQQIQALRQADMFQPVRVADFIIEKDRLFAEINLDRDELGLYNNIYDHLTIDAPMPDLVIYLQAPADTLMGRVQLRGVASEQHIELAYLTDLIEAYARFFHFYDATPLLIVNAKDIDLAHTDADYAALLDCLPRVQAGRHFYNPKPAIF